MVELEANIAALPRLLRCPALTQVRRGRTKTAICRRIWHDTADGVLRRQGLALSEQAGTWRLERLVPDDAADWPPASPAPVLAEGGSPLLLHRKLTQATIAMLVPSAAMTGTRRTVALHAGGQDGSLDILAGTLRGVASDEPVCRIVLCGEPRAMAELATSLAAQCELAVPRSGLAARALAHAAGGVPPPRQLGTPSIPAGSTVAGALVLVIAHLTDVILYWASRIPESQREADMEPVHQMRVAVRRLRSALAIFRRAATAPDAAQIFKSLSHGLKAVAATLGEARDWDVFLDGTGAALSRAFGGDKRIAGLIAMASRKRASAYATLNADLTSRAWNDLALRLALLPASQPWAMPAHGGEDRDEFGELRPQDTHAAMLAAPAVAYAAQALQRSLRRAAEIGEDFESLAPDAMHEARKRAKQLRYACEFFAPLFAGKSVKRFLERLEDVQETLGAVNDGHVAAGLMARLGTGADARFAAGAVQGYVAAVSAPAAKRAAKAWAKLLKQPPFWD